MHAQPFLFFISLQIRNLSFVKGVEKNIKVTAERPKSGCDECHSFSPERDNWGLARISSEDALPEKGRWPKYLYEKEMDVDIYILDTGILETHEEFEVGRARWGFTGLDAADRDKDLEFGPDYVLRRLCLLLPHTWQPLPLGMNTEWPKWPTL